MRRFGRHLQMTLSLHQRAGDFLPGVRERRVWRGRRAIPANSGSTAPKLGQGEGIFPEVFPFKIRSDSGGHMQLSPLVNYIIGFRLLFWKQRGPAWMKPRV